MKLKEKREVLRINGRLRELVTIRDDAGNIMHKVLNPLMVEFSFRDFIQVILGASLLAIPVAYTEETWNMGATLPLQNILLLMLLSVLFISTFIYYTYYRNRLHQHKKEFVKRVLATYVFSFLVVGLILVLIDRAPWTTDFVLAYKRAVLVTFPASMSAAIADTLK